MFLKRKANDFKKKSKTNAKEKQLFLKSNQIKKQLFLKRKGCFKINLMEKGYFILGKSLLYLAVLKYNLIEKI